MLFPDTDMSDKDHVVTFVLETLKVIVGTNAVAISTRIAGGEGGLRWNGQALKTVGKGLEKGLERRLSESALHVNPVSDREYDKCRTVGDLIDVLWSNIWELPR